MTVEEAKKALDDSIHYALNAATHGHVARSSRVARAVEDLIRAMLDERGKVKRCPEVYEGIQCSLDAGHAGWHRA